jgi:hypothetical protein
MEYLEMMAISVILGALKVAFKNPEKAAGLKSALLKVRDQITMLYPEA